MTDPARPIRPPIATPSIWTPEATIQAYRELVLRIEAMEQSERASNTIAQQEIRDEIAALGRRMDAVAASVQEAVQAGETCREQTRAMRDEFRETLKCLEKVRELNEKLEDKLRLYRRESKSMSEEAIAKAQQALSNTGRFDSGDVRDAAEEVVRRNELEKIEAEQKQRSESRRTVVNGILIGVGVLLATGMIAFMWRLATLVEGLHVAPAPPALVAPHP